MLPPGKRMPGFQSRNPITNNPTIYLPENPTILEVKHELSHWLDYKRLGVEQYSSLTRFKKEQMVLDRLQSNRIWENVLNDQEKAFSIGYVDKIKTEQQLGNNLGSLYVRKK